MIVRNEMIDSNLSKSQNLLEELNKNASDVNKLAQGMLINTINGNLSTNKGLSFLELKNQMLCSYLTNLAYVILRKCSGEKLESDASIERLAEIRTVLEKIKPIEFKLKYQIEKLLRNTLTGVGVSKSDDPSKFKANPQALAVDALDPDDEADEDGDEDEVTKIGIYVPPKLSAVYYDGDESVNDKIRKADERSRKRAISGAILRELKEEYLDTPVEDSISRERKVHLDLGTKRKIDYEENYMTRLPVTKQEKHRSRQMTTLNTLGDEITSFSMPKIPKVTKSAKKKGLKGKGKKKFKRK